MISIMGFLFQLCFIMYNKMFLLVKQQYKVIYSDKKTYNIMNYEIIFS